MAERIYIAGPYAPRDCSLHDAARQAQRNVDRAIAAANICIDRGHFVFVPHLSHYIHIHASCLRDYGAWWYDEDNTFLEHWATAILYLHPSFGADNELRFAQRLGLKVYRSVMEVPDLVNKLTSRKSRRCKCKSCLLEMDKNQAEKHYRECHPTLYKEMAKKPGFGAEGIRSGETRWWMFSVPREDEII